MTNLQRLLPGLLPVASLVLFGNMAFAQNSVVVVPMAGDDTSVQHYRLAETISTNDTFCATPGFHSPPVAVQVVAQSNTSATVAPADPSWFTNIQYSTNAVDWTDMSSEVTVTSTPVANYPANVSENAILELDPDTTYYFRMKRVNLSQTNGKCELVLSFTKKTADFMTIIEEP